ncbi:protein TRANSPARENT TESTA 9 [Cannabis sativa]|uniref:protein TRANSPARENT TESTA 9 n=1 Tax=Cannabis sativa TaxID=3483 RepID=UPI0029CA9B2A|nr:protein TRANSPARENT TESTA 9 [Cannabis sativa]
MWLSFFRPLDRFSLQNFKYVVNELREIKVVDEHNKESVVDLLQSVVEIVTYGDKQDPMIFEYFMECQVLAEFLRVLKISRDSRIEIPLLQYLSIMIQNMDSEHAIYYCFSNDYINNIIEHQYQFNRGDLAQYYVSFLRAISGKVNKDTLCLLVKVKGNSVVSFPLYNEALKFAFHEEKMIQTAVCSLALSLYYVCDDMVYQYITTPPVSKYFSDLVIRLSEQCSHLDFLVRASEDTCIEHKRKQLFLQADKIADNLYYLKDILNIGESRLSRLVAENLLSLLVLPILQPLLQSRKRNVSNLSGVTSLYLVSRLLQVIDGKGMMDPVAGVILYLYFDSSDQDAIKDIATSNHFTESFSKHQDKMEEKSYSVSENEEKSINYPPCHDSFCDKRGGLSAFLFSENQTLQLASLFLLLIVSEIKDLDCSLFPKIGLNGMHEADKTFITRFLDQILNVLLKVLASQTPLSAVVKWHTGWFLRKLLNDREEWFCDHNLQLFNTSFEQSRQHLEEELDGCWFDHILDTLINEWGSCKTVLEESFHSKDAFFILELAVSQITTYDDETTLSAWQRMVDSVKVFVLHLQLKSYMLRGNLLEHPLLCKAQSLASTSGQIHSSDVSSATFGSEVSLASGLPCRIAFSKAGIRDIYIIPVATGTSGRLLLTEKHPFRSQRGVVLAVAPLAGLTPKIDDIHPTWLHLRIREFDPKFSTNTIKGSHSNMSSHYTDGKWTLGFQNADTCEAARFLILKETRKQRSKVESLLSPLLHNKDWHKDEWNGHNK